VHQPSLTCWQSGNRKGANTWLASQGSGASRPRFGSVAPGLCAMSSPRVTLSVTKPYFGHDCDVGIDRMDEILEAIQIEVTEDPPTV
jgi:hypothetical protein